MDIAAWLNGLGLGRYERTFSEHDIGDDVLVDLGGADLEKLGVSLGDRKRLLKALAALRPAAPRDVPEPALPRQAERRQLTVMFVDLVGSTALSRSLDPEDLRDVLGAYQALAARAIERYGGYVAKLLGDGILVYFGWPTAHEDDAERAILAGLALVEAIRNGPVVAGSPLAVRVGIATGLTVVGAFTAGVPEGEAVVGETPNLAARLQALAEPNCVVIAASTRRLTRGRFGLADLGARELKGFAEPVSTWRVIGPSDGDDRFAVRAAVGLTQLVGREAELAALVDCWRRSAAGHGQAVVVSGEPGIGKSRLTQALVERLRGEPLTLLYYHCSPHHVQSALWPVVGYLEHAAGFHGGDTPEAKLDKVEALLAHAGAVDPPALSLFATLLELPVPGAHVPHLSPLERRTELLDALVRHLQSLAASRPALVVLEDGHWADPTTLELVDRVAEGIGGMPVLLLVTTRPEFLPAWSGRPNAATIKLDRLNRQDAATLVARVAGSRTLSSDAIEHVAERTDGVPLFLEELTKTLIESGLLRREGERLDVEGPSLDPMVPETLRDSLVARLDRFGPAKEVAQIGAVIGREFSHRLLSAVVSLPPDRLSAALAELAGAELIFVSGDPPEATYTFKHALVQEAVYSTLPKSRRRQLHAGIVAALERDFPDQVQAQPELIAYHATNAEQLETAVGYWCKAGERGLARAAMKEANAVYSRALDIVRRLPPSDRRERTELEILLELGRTQQAIRGSVSDECGRTFGRARQLAERSGQAEHLVEALKGLMYFHQGRTELNRAAEVAGARLEISKGLGWHPEIVAAYDDLATVSFSNGDFQDALDLSSSALSIIEADDRYSWSGYIEDAHRSVLILWAQTMTILGSRDQALAACDRAMSMVRVASHDYTLVTTLGNVCFVDQVCGRDESLAKRAEEMVKVSTRRGFPTWLARGLIFEGWRRAVHLQEEAGLLDMRDGLARLHTIGAKVWWPYYLGLLAHACGAVGQLDAGLDAVAEAMAMAEPDGEQDHLAELHRIRGTLHWVRGDRSAAMTCFQRALTVARRQKARLWELRAAECLAQLWAEDGERRKALGLLAPVYEWFTEGLDGPDLRRCRELLRALGWKETRVWMQ